MIAGWVKEKGSKDGRRRGTHIQNTHKYIDCGWLSSRCRWKTEQVVGVQMSVDSCQVSNICGDVHREEGGGEGTKRR